MGVHLMKLGKIQLYVEQFAAAEKSLQQVTDSNVILVCSSREIFPVCTLCRASGQ